VSGAADTTTVAALRIGATVVAWMLAAWWVLAAHPLQGPVLLKFTEVHGVHLGDLLAPAIAAAITVGVRPRHGGRSVAPSDSS
jgi:hypothetical protein